MRKEKTLLATRHKGAIEWIKRKGFNGEVVSHISAEMIGEGDTVIGNIPVHMIEEIKQKGARVFIIVMPQVPKEMRGQELTAEQMEQFGAKLLEVKSIELREVH